MSKWIDADAIKDLLMKYIGLTNGFDRAFSEAPSIDIVRCQDCKYWGDTICERFEEERIMFADDFCSYGEREGE